MIDGINELSESNSDKKIQITRQADSAKGPLLNPKESSIGMHAVQIKDSEELGPQAYNADDAGMTAFQMQNQSHAWGASAPPGRLEGHVTKESPDNLYILLFVKNGEFWIKYIMADSIAMNMEIEMGRAEMKSKMYQRGVQVQFDELVKRINLKHDLDKARQEDASVKKNQKQSVVTSASDDFIAGSSGVKFTEEASPQDMNPKDKNETIDD